jgi:outer membrane protein assembly factor BamB
MNASGPIKTSPVIYGAGIVYVGSDDDHVDGFDAYTDHSGGAISPTYTSALLPAQTCAGLAIDNRGIVYGGHTAARCFTRSRTT